MGELSLASGTPAEARAWHEQALVIAAEIASLPEEARALEGIGRSYLRAGERDPGVAALRRALATYQQIGSPNATRVAATLRDLPRALTGR